MMKMKYALSERVYAQVKEIINKFNKYTFKIFGSRARCDFRDSSDIDLNWHTIKIINKER